MHKRRALASLLTVFLAMTPADLSPQERTQGRSMTISRHGIVAAESSLAAQAGLAMLESGGNAIDAAVAANAMMGLVAPMSNGIGGDLFAIVFDAKSGKYYGLNASGWAPAGLSVEHLRSKGHRRMPQLGIHSVTVPGAVDGWNALLTRFGRKKLADVLAPSIRAAEEGFPVTEWVNEVWTRAVTQAGPDSSIPLTYLVNGRAPRVGEIFRNPDLAWSYRQIAANGRDAFYKGEI
ncbi:MAG TPA: gamma-glutamyltransferase, partial [Candidatus Acidoferrales bacterium]|nr:gamma-glutamyltransferase [Candidatus Acidoferrales bacterium]